MLSLQLSVPPSRSHCSGQSFGHRCAWKRMTPIGVGRVQQVEQLERQTWDRCVRGLLAPSTWVETARSPRYVLLLLRVAKGRATMVSQRIRSWRILLTNGGTWSEDSSLWSLSLWIGNSLGCCFPCFSWSGELFGESILSTGETQGSGQYCFQLALVSLIEYVGAGGYRLSFTIPTSVNQRSQLLNRICFYFQRALGSVFERRNVNELAGKTDQAWRCWGPDMNAHWRERYLN
jgi:hypothetical protein